MGAGARKRRYEKRRAEKRKRKLAQKAQYARWAEEGVTKKTRRARMRSKEAKKGIITKHAVANCGNLGCLRCFPSINKPFNDLLAAQRKRALQKQEQRKRTILASPARQSQMRAEARKRSGWR